MIKRIRRKIALTAEIGAAAATAILVPAGTATQAQPSPIQHIVVLDLENHSFDSVLGYWCDANPGRCPAGGMPSSVTLSNGTVVTPGTSPDVVPLVNHSVAAQVAAMDGGKMDGWENIPYQSPQSPGCTAASGWQCITGYQLSQVPNITSLATQLAISDRFFSFADSPSWGGHMYAIAGTTDGFTGDNPVPVKGVTAGPGWGCDSHKAAAFRYGPRQPSCVPDFTLGLPNGGAFEPTKALYVPTIMDRLDAAGLTWRIYGQAQPPSSTGAIPYGWSVCPSFAECLYTSEHAGLVDESRFFTDASAGTLPSFSLITAGGSSIGATDSCHNGFSMTACDNYVGQVAQAVMGSPEWSSTALFITWDDFGGFYDQVPPGINPDGSQQGPRLPLIAVSPWAKPAFTDDTRASFASILKFTEEQFGLLPLEASDSSASTYDLSNMFNLTGAAHLENRPRMVTRPMPKGERIDWAQARQGT